MVNRDFGLSGSGFGLSGSDPFFIPALFLLSLITRTIVFFSRFIPALFFQLFLRWFSMLAKMLVNPVFDFFSRSQKWCYIHINKKNYVLWKKHLYLWDKFV